MAVYSFSVTHIALFCVVALFIILFSNPILILSTPNSNDNPNFFNSHISLYADAAFFDAGSYVRLTKPSISSAGMVMYQEDVRFDDDVSFSAHFSFSISEEKGDGVVFLIGSNYLVSKFSGEGRFGLGGVDRFVGVEFDTSGDENRVGIDVSSLLHSGIVNMTDVDLVLNSGKKLQSWIDYEAGTKLIEVRLSEFGSARPYYVLVSYSLDLGQMWKGEEVYMGISGSSGNSTQSISLYSCKFVVRDVKGSLNSQPLKEGDQSKNADEGYVDEQKNRFCALSILAGLIFTTGCGALMAFVILFLWVVFVDRHRIQAEPDFKYENINVVVETDMEVVNK